MFIEICTVEKEKGCVLAPLYINQLVFRFQGNMKYRHMVLSQKPSKRCPNLEYFVFNIMETAFTNLGTKVLKSVHSTCKVC